MEHVDIVPHDPGIVFVLWPPSKVHAALPLLIVSAIRPGLQQGKKLYWEISVPNGIFVLPGGNAEQSVQNLYKWLDDMATVLGLGHSFTVAFNGNLSHWSLTSKTQSVWETSEVHVLLFLTVLRKWHAKYALIFEVSKFTKKPASRFLKIS